jgi:hypothetical protein
MNYIFRGNLCGYLCSDCSEPLSGIKVRLYRPDEREDITSRAVARPDDTFHQVGDDDLDGKSGRLIAETTVDEKGEFTFNLSEENNYDGKAFDIDIWCPTGYRRPIPPPKDEAAEGLQFHITTLQPLWRANPQTDRRELSYFWRYCIPTRWWCRILALLGLWVICGRVVDCEREIAISGVKVFAFDADWLQDDPLGSAVTDTGGNFRIYYTRAQFEKTIFSWLNLEWVSGPDLYFRIESASAQVLLQEPRSAGRAVGRQNVGNCFCVKLCVPFGGGDGGGDGDPQPIPAFLRIGGIDYQTGMHSAPFGNGLTNSSYAFFSTLRLNGILSRTLGGQPMEYCFEYTKDFDGAGLPINWQRVLPGQIGQTNIGYVEKANFVALPFPHWEFDNKNVYVNGAPPLPGDIIVTPDAQGWILVPQNHDDPTNAAGVGLFVANGNQIMLDSTSLMPFPAIDLTGLAAGNDTTSTGHALAHDEVFALRMLAREQGNDASKVQTGMCNRIAIDNTLYNGMSHHPEWGAWGPVTEYGVCLVDIEQLQMAGCAKITTQVDIAYSVAHPHLGSIGMTLTGPMPTVNLGPIPVSPNSFGTVTHLFAPTDPQCAYLVTLSATYLLTTGDSNLSGVQDQIAFCR